MKKVIVALVVLFLAAPTIAQEEQKNSSEKPIVGWLARETLVAVSNVQDESDGTLPDGVVSDFWIAVQCDPVSELRYSPVDAPELVLPLDGGMRLNTVYPGGAAAESGLKDGDILVSFGGVRIKQIKDLYVAIGKTKDSATEVTFLRDGNFKQLEIMPKKRPVEEKQTEKDLTLWRGINHAVRESYFPGRIPEGYEITISVKPNTGVNVEVEKEGHVWAVEPEKFKSLPEDVSEAAIRWYQLSAEENCGSTKNSRNQRLWSDFMADNFNAAVTNSQRQNARNVGALLDIQAKSSEQTMLEKFEQIQSQLNELAEIVKGLKKN